MNQYKLLEEVFEYVEIQSPHLKNQLLEIIHVISKTENLEELYFGPVIEGSAYSGEAGEVTEDGIIYLDYKKLSTYEDSVSQAIIAHELAHSFLKHYETIPEGLEHEIEADEKAIEWGFAIGKFRNIYGEPTISDK